MGYYLTVGTARLTNFRWIRAAVLDPVQMAYERELQSKLKRVASTFLKLRHYFRTIQNSLKKQTTVPLGVTSFTRLAGLGRDRFLLIDLSI